MRSRYSILNGVGISTPHSYATLQLQRRTGGFQRPNFALRAPQWWMPSPHSYETLMLQPHIGGLQRPILMQYQSLRHTGDLHRPIPMYHCTSSATLMESSASFLCIVTFPAPRWWIPTPHSLAASIFQRNACGHSITTPAPHWWIPAPHSYAALRLQRRTGGFQRPIFL